MDYNEWTSVLDLIDFDTNEMVIAFLKGGVRGEFDHPSVQATAEECAARTDGYTGFCNGSCQHFEQTLCVSDEGVLWFFGIVIGGIVAILGAQGVSITLVLALVILLVLAIFAPLLVIPAIVTAPVWIPILFVLVIYYLIKTTTQ